MKDWSFSALMAFKKKHNIQKNHYIHVQYPTLGMGNSIIPAFLPALFKRRQLFLTLHEFSVFHKLRRSIFSPYALFSNRIIFTNQDEQTKFLNAFPVAKDRVSVIPIGSNIPRWPQGHTSTLRDNRVVYFGQISENKGLEFFIEAVRQLRYIGNNINVAIIGSVVAENSRVVSLVRNSASQLNIELLLNLSSDNVAAALARSTIALLPFPDGITEKRGSALACIENEISIITCHTRNTPEWLRGATYHADTPIEASLIISKISNIQRSELLDTKLVKREMAKRDWANIAEHHIQLYSNSIIIP